MKGLVDLGHHVGAVGQRGLDLLEPLRKQRQLLPVVERERKKERNMMSEGIDENYIF